jgi:hypothetical protein
MPLDQGPAADGTSQPTRPQNTPASGERGAVGVSLWADRNLVSGPINAAKDFVSQIPGAGAPFSDVAIARQGAKQQAERVVEALLKSAQGSVREQERLAPVIGIAPDALRGGDAYGNKIISLGKTLREMIEEFESQGKDDSGLKPADKGLARKKASEYRQHYNNLGLPPVVRSYEESLRYDPGTEVLFNGITLGKIPARNR